MKKYIMFFAALFMAGAISAQTAKSGRSNLRARQTTSAQSVTRSASDVKAVQQMPDVATADTAVAKGKISAQRAKGLNRRTNNVATRVPGGVKANTAGTSVATPGNAPVAGSATSSRKSTSVKVKTNPKAAKAVPIATSTEAKASAAVAK